MRFGTFNILGWGAGEDQDTIVVNGVRRIESAEQFGFSSAWLTEHHFANDPAYNPWGFAGNDCTAYDLSVDPLTILSYAAARTSTIRLGTDVIVLPFENPIRVAERTALLDVLSKGRLEVGIGRGGGHTEPAAFGVPPEGVRERFGEALDILITAWSGQRFSFSGEYYSVPELAVVPQPRQRPHPPIYIAAISPDSFGWAGKRGFPYAYVGGAWGPITHDVYATQHGAFLDAADEAGHETSGMEFPHVLLMYCARTDGEADAMAERHVLRHFVHSEGHYEHRRYGNINPTRPQGRNTSEEVMQSARDTVGLNLIGTPDTCIRRIERYLDLVDLNYLLVCPTFGSLPHDDAARSMELFAEKVLPAFEDR